jgi:hypothetical protein
MTSRRIAYSALAGLLAASLGAAQAAAATYVCWKSNGKTVCVKKTGPGVPPDCKTKPCAVVSSGQGGNNIPQLQMPAAGAKFAAKDDIRVGLPNRLDATKHLAGMATMSPAMAPNMAAQKGMQTH